MEEINAKSIFSQATGFIQRGGFEWTCNPYLGCTFGCTYCYAMFLPQNRRPKEDWGRWLGAKVNAIELARKSAPKLAGRPIYMSSVTDPYVPAERRWMLTRGILEQLVQHSPRLLIQTRGPLVSRDIDLFEQFASIRVNMSLPTDSEEIRSIFEPKAPPLERRWQALQHLKSHRIAIGICITPMLPLQNMERFVRRVLEFDPEVLVVQDFHESQGGFGADTGEKARRILSESAWCQDDYVRCKEMLARHRTVYEGEAGFFPPPLPTSEKRCLSRACPLIAALNLHVQ